MIRTLAAACVFLTAMHAAMPSAEARRVALVVGISAYEHLASLKNPVPDAKAIATALRRNGFDVSEHYDLSRADLLDALEAFKDKAESATVALVYYAGHGMEIQGKNILAPRDMQVQCQPKKAKRAVRVQQLFDAVGGAPKQIVLLDACRNDPFPQCPSRAARAGTGFRGLSRITTDDSALLIANATLSGQLAADGDPGKHSPFAKALLARFEANPTMYFRDLLDGTAEDVRRATGGSQVPEVTSRGGAPRVCISGQNCGGASGGASVPEIAINAATRAEVQTMLAKLGFQVGGSRSPAALARAIRAFQSSAGLPADGKISATLLAVLRATSARVAAIPRPQAIPRPGAGGVFRQELEHEVGATFKDCESCPEMVVVPAGQYNQGSNAARAEQPVHGVRIARPLAIAKFEITFDQWEACALEGGCQHKPKDSGWGRGRRPVINVSWDDAKSYITWLRRSTGKPYRLPSEAEWEFAARAGTTTAYASGNTLQAAQANYDGTQGPGGRRGVYHGKTLEVGSFPANPFGLHDMHGNVAEWVEDCWNPTHAGAPSDGSARGGDCARRVLKGGAWYYEAAMARSAARLSYPKRSRLNIVGFRVVRPVE